MVKVEPLNLNLARLFYQLNIKSFNLFNTSYLPKYKIYLLNLMKLKILVMLIKIT